MAGTSKTPVGGDDYLQKVVEGTEKGGALWIGRPAQTDGGRKRERTCKHSEAAVYGSDWISLSRCPKQAVYSCDGCFRYTQRPFYSSVKG